MKKYLILSLSLSVLSTLLYIGIKKPHWFTSETEQEIIYETVPLIETAGNGQHIQVALILDTSNSMDGLIEQTKSQLWKLVNELADIEKDGTKPQIEIALFQYGNSHLSLRNGYIEKVMDLSTDLDELSRQLFMLRTNGGDEYCGQAIDKALEELLWSNNKGDLKMIFIAGNESFDQGPISYQDIISEAKSKGIIVNTIHCGDYQIGVEDYWEDGALLAGGKYMNINQNDEVRHIATPWDEAILKLNQRLNDTYIGYGKEGAAKKSNQALQDANSQLFSAANARTRAISKSKSVYINDSWDLVDYTSKHDISSIKEVELPEELKGLSKKEQKEYLEKLRKERKVIQEELNSFDQKVKDFVAKEKMKQAKKETIDNVLVDVMLEQAEQKGFKKN